MGLPAKLKNFMVHVDGGSYAGAVEEITLPKLTLKTEAYRGGGMLGELDVSMGLEKLEMEETYGGIVVEILRGFGAIGTDASLLRFTGAYQGDAGVVSAELVTLGMMTEIDPGNSKAGDNSQWKVKRTLSYLKWTVAGRVEIEIDVLNNIFIVDGIDRMAAVRAALQQ